MRTTWMIVGTIVLTVGIGCGSQNSKTGATNQPVSNNSALEKEIPIPAEVQELYAHGETAQAIEVLTTMIDQAPNNADLYYLRSNALHQLRQTTAALVDIDRAIELDSTNAKFFNNRGFIRLGAMQFQKAGEDFDRAIELAPRYKHAFNNRGLLQVAQGKFAEAIPEFNQAILIDGRFVDAFNNRGFAEFELGQTAKALDDFNIAIELKPDYVNAWNNRGLLRTKAGDYDNAVLDFIQAMMIDPLNPKYYQHRQDVYRKLGDIERVVEDKQKIEWLVEYHELTAAIATTTRPAPELVRRADHYSRVEEYEKALDDLDRAIAIDAKSIEALMARASIKLRQKKFAAAVADAEAVIAISSKVEAYSILGDAFLGLRDYDRAIENYHRARRIDMNVAEAYYENSKALRKRGDVDRAKTSLEQALALDPEIENRLR